MANDLWAWLEGELAGGNKSLEDEYYLKKNAPEPLPSMGDLVGETIIPDWLNRLPGTLQGKKPAESLRSNEIAATGIKPSIDSPSISAGAEADPTRAIRKFLGNLENGRADTSQEFKPEGGGFMRANKMVFAEPIDPFARSMTHRINQVREQALQNALRAANGQTPQNWYEPVDKGGPYGSSTLWRGRDVGSNNIKSTGLLGPLRSEVKSSIDLGNTLAGTDRTDPKMVRRALEQQLKQSELTTAKGEQELKELQDPQAYPKKLLGAGAMQSSAEAERSQMIHAIATKMGVPIEQAIFIYEKLKGKRNELSKLGES